MGVTYVRKLEKTLETGVAEKGIIVAKSRYTYAAKRDARKYGIELIPRIFPSFNLFKHKMVPKHEVLPPEEAKAVFEEYSVEPYQLPRINASDIAAIARKFGWP